MSEKGPTSEDLNRTVDLLAGLGDERPETGECSDQVMTHWLQYVESFLTFYISFYSQQSTKPLQKVKRSLVLCGSF